MTNQTVSLKTLLSPYSLVLFLLFPSVVCAEEQQAPPAMPVTIAHPEVEDLIEYDEFTGRFEAYQEVRVQARVSGYLEKIHFTDGQHVEVGDPLFSIDARPYQAVADVAQAELARTQSQRVLAEQEVKRARRLVEKNAMSQEELDTRSAALQTNLANVEAARAALRKAKLDLEYTDILAPISGRISDRRVDIGNLIQSEGGQTLTSIVADEPVYFIFDVAEGDYLIYQRRLNKQSRKSLVDGSLKIRVRLLDEEDFLHEGSINFIDNQLDQGTSTIRLRAIFADNSNGLLVPGVFGRVQIPVSDRQSTLLIPDKAILSDMANKIVMTVNDENVVVPKPVQLGSLHGQMRVIKSGLEKEDRVIIEGLFRARPGTKVAPHFPESETGGESS